MLIIFLLVVLSAADLYPCRLCTVYSIINFLRRCSYLGTQHCNPLVSHVFFGIGTKFSGKLPTLSCIILIWTSVCPCCSIDTVIYLFFRMPRCARSRSRSGTRISGRGRSRSRDRTTRRHRHRGHGDSISRSASRGLYDQPEEPVQAIKKLVASQQEIILDLHIVRAPSWGGRKYPTQVPQILF